MGLRKYPLLRLDFDSLIHSSYFHLIWILSFACPLYFSSIFQSPSFTQQMNLCYNYVPLPVHPCNLTSWIADIWARCCGKATLSHLLNDGHFLTWTEWWFFPDKHTICIKLVVLMLTLQPHEMEKLLFLSSCLFNSLYKQPILISVV